MAKRKTKKQAAPVQSSIRPALDELERIYGLFAPLFEGEFKSQPVITIQSAGRRNALGWMAPSRWNSGGKTQLNEINICAERLAGPIEEIAETVLHEMVHHWNQLAGISDCSKNQYHNKNFKLLAMKVGLTCQKMGRYGWANTDLTPELRETVSDFKIDETAFSIFRIAETQAAAKQDTRMKKWTCTPDCTIIRAAGDIDVQCNLCGESFERDEDS